MKVYLKVLLGVSALLLTATQVQAASSTASPGAAQTPTAIAVNKVVGTSASFLSKFMAFDCTFDAIGLADGDNQVHTCTIPGVKTTDRVIVTNPSAGPGTDTAVSWCAFPVAAWIGTADIVSVRLLNVGAASCDGASIAYQFLVYRPNKN